MSVDADLLHRYLSGTLSDDELGSFVARLETDRDLARAWREAVENDAMLWEFGQGKVLSRLRVETSGRPRRRRSLARPATGLWALLLSTAAGLIVAVGVFWPSAPPPPVPVSVAPSAPPAPEAIAPAPESPSPPPGVPRQTPTRPVKRVGPGKTSEPEREKEEPGKPSPPAPKKKEPPRPTVAAAPAPIATLDQVRGTVERVRGGEASAVVEGTALRPGDGLRLASDAGVDVVFPDGTRLSLAESVDVESIRIDGPGKRVMLRKGSLRADVAKQPAKAPMKFATPHGEATVLGTVLRILVDPDPRKGSMRTEVIEGRVRVRNRAARSVEVGAGHFAVAGPGRKLAATPLPRTPAERMLLETGTLTVNFGPQGTILPPNVLNDSGEEFAAARGYGWTGPNAMVAATGWAKRTATARPATGNADVLRATHVGAGWADRAEAWNLAVPNGRYLVTVCVGDPGSPEQGPHHVVVEGLVVINARFTKAGEYVEPKDVPVRVRDGKLTVSVGGHRSARAQSDGTSDTVLTFVVVKRIR